MRGDPLSGIHWCIAPLRQPPPPQGCLPLLHKGQGRGVCGDRDQEGSRGVGPAYADGHCHLFEPPVIPDHHYSPEPVPLAPCTGGPAEMLILMEGNAHQVKCFCCKKRGHKAQECPQKKHRACTICKDHGHRKAACPYCTRGKVEVFVEMETKKGSQGVGPAYADGHRRYVQNAAKTPGIPSRNALSTSFADGARPAGPMVS